MCRLASPIGRVARRGNPDGSGAFDSGPAARGDAALGGELHHGRDDLNAIVGLVPLAAGFVGTVVLAGGETDRPRVGIAVPAGAVRWLVEELELQPAS